MDLTLGQEKLLLHALQGLNGAGQEAPIEYKPAETAPVTTKSLASDGRLEELLKKIGGVSLMTDPLVTLGAT